MDLDEGLAKICYYHLTLVATPIGAIMPGEDCVGCDTESKTMLTILLMQRLNLLDRGCFTYPMLDEVVKNVLLRSLRTSYAVRIP